MYSSCIIICIKNTAKVKPYLQNCYGFNVAFFFTFGYKESTLLPKVFPFMVFFLYAKLNRS